MVNAHPATRIAVMQVFLIFGGVASVCAMMKVWGYPDPEIRWNPAAIAIRDWGLLLLLIPMVWAPLAIHWENRSEGWTLRWTVVSGFGLLILLFIVLAITAVRVRYFPLIRAV